MSLKAFHIFFIVVSALCAVGFSVWAVIGYTSSHDSGMLIVAAGSLLAGIGLIFYGIRFLRKLKHVSFL